MSDTAADRELQILQNISRGNGAVPQRALARVIGLSLGMTNSILKRLVHKGYLKIRKVNNRNIRYVVSPKGMEEIGRRAYRYLRRTIKNVVLYKEAIEAAVAEARQNGYRRVVLVGRSDLDFLVEHLSAKQGIAYSQRPADQLPSAVDRDFLLFSEKARLIGPAPADSVSLRGLLVRRTASEGAHACKARVAGMARQRSGTSSHRMGS